MKIRALYAMIVLCAAQSFAVGFHADTSGDLSDLGDALHAVANRKNR